MPLRPAIWLIFECMSYEMIEQERVWSIIGAFYDVYNYYGYGLPEAAYSGAMEYALGDRGHDVARELAVAIAYQQRHVCWIRIDLVVDGRIIVEIKATEKLSPFAERQLFNYLRATSFEVGLLLHFGPEPRFRRLVDASNRPAERAEWRSAARVIESGPSTASG